MSGHGRGRTSRGHEFDAGIPLERPGARRAAIPATGLGPEISATVKWFNADKGFGFVALGDGTGDAFLHVNSLGAIGQGAIVTGATLVVRLAQGPKGRQVSQVVSVDGSAALAVAPPSLRGAAGPAEEKPGVVKWFNPTKGFGFVAVPDGGKDVFVHVTIVQRAGLAELAEGQAVVVGVVQGAKGPEASFIRPG